MAACGHGNLYTLSTAQRILEVDQSDLVSSNFNQSTVFSWQ